MIKTNEAYAYWLLPINVTGIPGKKSTPRTINSLGPDGTTDDDVPGALLFDVLLHNYGTFSLENIRVPAIDGVQGADQNIEGITELHAYVVYAEEMEADIYAVLDTALPYNRDHAEDYATAENVAFHYSPRMVDDHLNFSAGDFFVINDTDEDAVNPPNSGANFRKYECFQITSISDDGSRGTMDIRRHYIGQTDPWLATFGSVITAHETGKKFYLLKFQHFSWKTKSNSAPLVSVVNPLPPRVDAVWPSVCIVSVMLAALNYYGFSQWTVVNCGERYDEDPKTWPAPGVRPLNGAAYVFRQDGDLAIMNDGSTPQQIHDWASVRTIYATVTDPPTGDNIQINMKYKFKPEDDWSFFQTLTIPADKRASYPDDQTPTERRMPFQDGYNYADPVYGPNLWPPPPLKGDALIGYDIVSAGSVNPGTNLMVYLQT